MKKRSLLVTLACSTLLLTSCNKITATLPNGDQPLTNTNIQIDHNTLDRIYKTIKGGDNYASNVNDILTQAIAKTVLGEYKFQPDTEKGFKIILDGYDNVDDAKKTAFIETHPAYKNWESSSFKLKLSEGTPTKEDFENRINIIKDLIEEKVVSTLWSEANATAYKRNNRFYEVLYARNLDEKLYKVTDLEGKEIKSDIIGEAPNYTIHYTSETTADFDGFKNVTELQGGYFTQAALIDGTYDINYRVEEEDGKDEIKDGFEKIKNVLHIGYYTDYINSSIMPTIMKNLLVEQYILEESYNSIGGTNSRKVNYISIANNADKDGDKFFKNFVTTYFTGNSKEDLELSTTDKFSTASNAWKGIPSEIASDEKVKSLATSVFGEATNENPSAGLDGHRDSNKSTKPEDTYIQKYKTKQLDYYKNTPYADLIEEYSTITNDISTNNSTNYDKFTTIDSNSYEPIVGLSIQEDALKVTDYTTYGWQTSESSALPDDIKNVLFSYGFINEWNAATETADDKAFLGTYLYEVGTTGKYLLKTAKYNDSVDSVLWQNGGNYYVVEIEDIITAGSTQIYGTDSEATLQQSQAEKFEIEEKSRDIAYTLASGTTFTTNAMIFYLEQCNINYHDQDVYDYFATTYPRLFE